MARLKACVVGGGTGAPVSIKTLLGMEASTCAVVAMADDGGSTGILREKAGAIPPGDIRKCLVAFANENGNPWVDAFKYRFDYASNHALGNLVLTALAETGLSFPEAISACEQLLEARGHVYPSTLDQVTLCGRTCDGRDIVGQSTISHSPCALSRVYYSSNDIKAYGPALEALRRADMIVLGPGSLFTSIIPNLLVPGVVEAIRESKAAVVFVCAIADQQGETWGLSAVEHVEALLRHGLQDRLDFVLINDDKTQPADGRATMQFNRITGTMLQEAHAGHKRDIRTITCSDAQKARIEALGPHVIKRNFVKPERPTWHEPALLRPAFEEVASYVLHRRG